ncbi:MAG: hypothetical protein AAF330_05155 [Pseudomonadota bacterium]
MTKLLITIPSNGKVHTDFMTSVIGLTQALSRRKISFAVKTYEFSDIMTSRNFLMSYFLTQESFTHALLLDSDLVFAPDQFFRLLEADRSFTGAYYPNRRIGMKKLRAAIEAEAQLPAAEKTPIENLMARTQRYIATNSLVKGQPIPRKVDDGFETVATAGTGFLLVTREVPETMAANGAARPLPRSGRLPIYQGATRFYDFFSHKFSDDGAFYGEDQSFCRRWVIDCGGEIWMDRASKVSHIGSYRYPGDYAEVVDKE